MHGRFMVLAWFLLSSGVRADVTPSEQLALGLLQLSGTATVFESEAVQKALRDPQPFLMDADGLRYERLLVSAGLRQWRAPRVWILAQSKGAAGWQNVAADYASAADKRGFTVVDQAPLPAAVDAIAFLRPGLPHDGLPALLAAYDADALLLLRGSEKGGEWALWLPGSAQQGALTASLRQPEALTGMLAELSAADQQWSAAHGRPVLRVDGVRTFADLSAVQASLLAMPGLPQLQLLQVGPDRVWFAWSAQDKNAFTEALQAEPRLPLRPLKLAANLPGVAESCRLWCRLQVREWRPEAAKPPVVAPGPLQSPPSP